MSLWIYFNQREKNSRWVSKSLYLKSKTLINDKNHNRNVLSKKNEETMPDYGHSKGY